MRSDRIYVAILLAMIAPVLLAAPAISNVRVAQQPGTENLEIIYDIADVDTTNLVVTVNVSTNNGTTWFSPASSNLTGAIAPTLVSPGANRVVTWRGFRELPSQPYSSTKVRVMACSKCELAWFKMDDNASNRVIRDSSISAFDATNLVQNTSARSVAGVIDSALTFQTVETALSYSPNALSVFDGDSWTVSYWGKRSTALVHSEWFWVCDSVNEGMGWYYNKDLNWMSWLWYYSPSVPRNISCSFPAATWKHFAFIRSGTNLSLYVDGALSGTTIPAGSPTKSTAMYFGGTVGQQNYNNTRAIDDLRVYDIPLSSANVTNLFNGGNGLVSPLFPLDEAAAVSPTILYTPEPYSIAIGQSVTLIGNTNYVCISSDNSGDGGSSVRLGGVGLPDLGTAGVECVLTGPGLLSFEWKVSSEQDFDFMRYYEVGSGATNSLSGTGSSWALFSTVVGGESNTTHTFRWEYAKDASDYVGLDCGWLDAVTWTPLYDLTVNQGSGDGLYTYGTHVAVTADAAPQWHHFHHWIGDTNNIANAFASATTLVMPATDVAVTATYTPTLYSLAVANGGGGGAYPYGSTVEIFADPLAGKRFYRWTGDVDFVADALSATTMVMTAGRSLSVAATYSVLLTVNAGSGGGWNPEGSVVAVAADPDPLYKEFDVWTGDAASRLSDATARSSTLVMPTEPATLTASYRDAIARVAGSYGRTFVVSGEGGGVSADASSGSPSGTPAAKLGGAGVVPDNCFAAFETVVSGSGTLTFWWRVSSEINADYLTFKVDGGQVAAISGTKGAWAQVSHRIEGAGLSHTLRWEYAKNGSLASSTDAGWVDDIVWTGDVPDPTIEPDIRAATVTDNVFALTFLGERGIPYSVYSNAALRATGWLPMGLVPQNKGETNGLFRYEAFFAPPADQRAGFYRVKGGD